MMAENFMSRRNLKLHKICESVRKRCQKETRHKPKYDNSVRFFYIRKESGLKRDGRNRKRHHPSAPFTAPPHHPTAPLLLQQSLRFSSSSIKSYYYYVFVSLCTAPLLFIFVFQLPHHFRIHTFTVNMCNVSKYLLVLIFIDASVPFQSGIFRSQRLKPSWCIR